MTFHDCQQTLATLLKAFPKETVRSHPLVGKARAKAQKIEARLAELQCRASPTKSERSGMKLTDGDAEQAQKTDQAAPAHAVARGALAHAAKVCEGCSIVFL